MKTLVFSDVHLNVAEDGRDTMAAFISFLRGIDPREVNRIVIVGDLFDFWFEYNHVIFSGYFDVLRALADLRDAGVEMHFAVGNHDFWAGRFLKDQLGIVIHDRPFILPFGTQQVLFTHGDGINPNDTAYRVYKRFARWKPVVAFFSLIHPDWAMGLAQWVSRGSRKMFQAEDLSTGSEVRPLQDFAKRRLAAGAADVVVCGHSHNPVIEEYPTPDGKGLYINSGDWLYHQSYVEWDGSTFRMRLFGSQVEDVDEAEVIPQGQTAEGSQEG